MDIIEPLLQDNDESVVRLNAGELDKLFIEYYLHTGSKTEAYRRSARAYGHEFKSKYAAQYGKKMYDRLHKDIEYAIDQADMDDDILGRKIQRELAKTAESESVKLSAATALRRKKTEKLEITDNRTSDDIDTDIERLWIEVNQKDNKHVN